MNKDALRHALLLGLLMVAAPAIHAARTVENFDLPSCPRTSAPTNNAETVVVPNVRVTNTSGSDWRSTKFTWTDAGGNSFTNCIDTPNRTSNGTHTLDADFDDYRDGFIAPAPTEGYVSLAATAYSDARCSRGSSNTLTKNFGSACLVSVPNPDLERACGQDIILVLDESGSVSNSRKDVMDGARALVNSVKNTGSRIAMIEFSASRSRFVKLPNQTAGNYVEVTDATIPDFFTYLTSSPTPTGSSGNSQTYSPHGNTPWDRALEQTLTIHTDAAPARGPADMVILLTDGNPTSNNCTIRGPDNLQCAVQVANNLKGAADAPHMFVVAVGGGINIQNIEMISGLDEMPSGGTLAQLLKADYTQVAFSELEDLFRRMSFALCAPSVTVTKKVDPDGPDYPDPPVETALTEFVAQVDITESGQIASDYEWVDPVAGADCAGPTPEKKRGCPGPGLAGTVGTTQTGWTGDNGALNLAWIPHTQADPQLWNSQLVLSENIQSPPLFFREMSCERQRLNLLTGQITTTSFTCLRQRNAPLLPDGTPAPNNCVNGPTSGPNPVTECVNEIVCGDLDVDTDTTIQLGPGDIMTCEVINDDNSRLPVTLNYFRGWQAGGEIVFQWETASETDLLGFKPWAIVGGEWIGLGDGLVLAGGTESAAPQSYSARFSMEGLKGRPQALGLSSVDIDGTQAFYGPMKPGAGYGERIEVEPIDWDGIRGAVAERMAVAGYRTSGKSSQSWVRADAASTAGLATTAALASASLAAGTDPVYNLLVERTGMYRVTYEQLLAAGYNLNGVPARDIAVTSRGVRHARQVRAKAGIFGPGSWIAFFGEALTLPESLYTRHNVYQIQVDSALARETRVLKAKPSRNVELIHQARVEVNEQNGYTSTSPSGDPWYDTYAIAYPGTPTDIDVTLRVNHLVDQPAVLELGLWGITSFAGEEPDHHVRVLVNGAQVADETADGLVDMPLQIPLDGVLVEGENVVTIRVTGETGYAWDAVALDRYALVYPRELVANGSLRFGADAPGFKVTNLPDKRMRAYAWRDGTLTRITKLIKKKKKGKWSASFVGLSGETTYWVGSVSAMHTPEIAAAVEVSNDLMAPADLLIIAHPFFKERLLNPGGKPDFVAAKEAHGYSVAVKDLFEIYQAYGHGLPLPQAIKAYLQAMWQTPDSFRFALLVGGSTYDPLHNTGPDSLEFIPTWYEHTGQTIYFTPTDAPYGDYVGDIIPEQMVARWPVRTDGELDVIIQKSLDWYASGLSADPSALLIADQKDPAYPPFGAQMDRAGKWLGVPDGIGNPTEWADTKKVYLDDYYAASKTVPDARADLISRINDGVAMTLMGGHGSYSSWTNNGLLSYQHVSEMTNAGLPTLITPLSCYSTYFPSETTNTLGHRLLFEGDYGAVAIHGATAISSLTQNEVTAEKITKHFVHGNLTLGEAIIEAKKELTLGYDSVLNWQLNGDPTLKLTIEQP